MAVVVVMDLVEPDHHQRQVLLRIHPVLLVIQKKVPLLSSEF
jgi:hypothetical protein